MGGRRPTFPQSLAVSSARRGLTSLFGMGRGAPPRNSRHVLLWKSGGTEEDTAKEFSGFETGSDPATPPTAGEPARPHAPCPRTRLRGASFRAISSARLNASLRFHLRPIDVVVSHGPLRRPHLGASFALRCFQRLSPPDAATRRCVWRRNRCTVGPSDPVLSY